MADQNETTQKDAPLLPWESKGGGTSTTAAGESLSSLLTDDLDIEGDDTSETDEPEVAEADDVEEDLDEDVEEAADALDAVEEDDDSDESDEEDDSDDGEEDPSDDDEPRYEVEYPDGTKAQLTLEELKKEHLRQADYTRKTQAAAEERKAIEAERAQVRQERQEYHQRLEAVKTALEQVAPKRRTAAEWDTLKAQDPAKFAAEWADTQRHMQEMAEVEAEQARVQEQAQKEWAQQVEEHLKTERERLYQAVPEWKDEEVASKEKAELRSFAAERYGFNDQELDGVTDHRLMLLLRDAMQLNRISTKGKPQIEAKRKAAKVLQPGGRAPSTKGGKPKRAKTIRDKSRKLARSGSIDDAAALLMELADD